MREPAAVADSVEALLLEAGHAHREVFLSAGGVDPEWPTWYARYLDGKLQGVLGAGLTRSEIVYLLVGADLAYRAAGGDQAWSRFYGEYLLGRDQRQFGGHPPPATR